MSETRAPYTLDRPRELIADGIYVGLSMDDYVRDPALSGSAFRTLLTEPAELTWKSEANPLYIRPERAKDRTRLRGSAAHCAILEGLAAYEARYTVKPEGGLSSLSDLKGWLSAKRAAWIEASFDGKLTAREKDAIKQTGERADLIARIHAIDASVEIFDPETDGREVLHPADDQYVRLLERYVRLDPQFAPLVSGLAEVSIFWTETVNGRPVRFKARPDAMIGGAMNAAITDVKTFGRAPTRGTSLREHCVRLAGFNGFDLQAVHNARAGEILAAWMHATGKNAPNISYPAGRDPRAALHELAAAWVKTPPVFHWLFLRIGGAPAGVAIPFRKSDGQWHEAERQIASAIATYIDFADRFGEGELWFDRGGVQEIETWDWPLAATEKERRDDGEIEIDD
ncbi:MAG: hypothetical protein GC206_13250 [Alphaproteobacteria bacterium]|nr:hypothetical protein [Alphaproteobacteria bacterium]